MQLVQVTTGPHSMLLLIMLPTFLQYLPGICRIIVKLESIYF